jgi:hypothetical protein
MAAPKAIQTSHPQAFDLTVANTARDGTGTWVNAYTGVASPGSVLQRVDLTAIVATTQGNVKFAVYDGVANQYIDEINVWATVTPDSVNKPWSYHGPPPGGSIELPSATWIVRCAPEKGEAINGFSKGGDFV